MRYFFILGTNPTLSIAEILSVFPNSSSRMIVNEQVFVLENEEMNAYEVIRKLGGTIKIGIIKKEIEIKDYQKAAGEMAELINTEGISGKYKYGISFYGKGKFNTKSLGMEIKNCLKEKSVSARWVISKEAVLSSVVVEQNKMTPFMGEEQATKGIEFILFKTTEHLSRKEYFLGVTLAVQPFKEFSFRDFGRPARDDYSGMLPPKLAQIMINLALPSPPTPLPQRRERGNLLLDPFCGSGTVLTEAALMGYTNLIGSDISRKAIEDTRKNIEWTEKNYELKIKNYELFNLSATELSREVKAGSVDAIVTEPYLGPQRGKISINYVAKELEKLYSDSLKEFYKVLKPGGRVVMIWPVRKTPDFNFINPDIGKFKMINMIPKQAQNDRVIKLTDRGTIIYGREGQKVWREIVVLDK